MENKNVCIQSTHHRQRQIVVALECLRRWRFTLGGTYVTILLRLAVVLRCPAIRMKPLTRHISRPLFSTSDAILSRKLRYLLKSKLSIRLLFEWADRICLYSRFSEHAHAPHWPAQAYKLRLQVRIFARYHKSTPSDNINRLYKKKRAKKNETGHKEKLIAWQRKFSSLSACLYWHLLHNSKIWQSLCLMWHTKIKFLYKNKYKANESFIIYATITITTFTRF